MAWLIDSSLIEAGLPKMNAYDIEFTHQVRNKCRRLSYELSNEQHDYYVQAEFDSYRSVTNRTASFIEGLFIGVRTNDIYGFTISMNNNPESYHDHWHYNYVIYGRDIKVPFNNNQDWYQFVISKAGIRPVRRYTCNFNVDNNAYVFHSSSIDFFSGLITSLIWQKKFDDLLNVTIYDRFNLCRFELTYQSREHIDISKTILYLYSEFNFPLELIGIIESYYLTTCIGTDQYKCRTYFNMTSRCEYHANCDNQLCCYRCPQCANRHSSYEVDISLVK